MKKNDQLYMTVGSAASEEKQPSKNYYRHSTLEFFFLTRLSISLISLSLKST